MPDVELERARLREPKQRRQIVAEQVVVALVLVAGKYRNGFGKCGALLLPVFLEKALTVDAVRHPDHRQRTVRQMRQDERRYLREVAQQVPFGQRRLAQCRIGRPVDAIEVGQLQRVCAHRNREGGLVVVKLTQHIVYLAVGALLCTLSVAPSRADGNRTCLRPRARSARRSGHADRFRRHLSPHCLRIDVVAQPQKHRSPQMPVFGPVVELHFCHKLRRYPCRRCIQFRLGRERIGFSLQRLELPPYIRQ